MLHLALTLGLALSLPAQAGGEADEAEINFQRGALAYQAGDYTEALAAFLASNRLAPNRNVMYNIARCYDALGQYPAAHRWYMEALRGESDEATVQRLKSSIQAINPKVALFQISTDPPGATLYVNRRDLGALGQSPATIALAPGEYTIIADLPGHRGATSQTFKVKAGALQPVRLELPQITSEVRIDGPAGATVHLGVETAASACSLPCALQLPPGTHLLHFQQPGFRGVPVQIQVAEGQAQSVKAELVARTGGLIVDVGERGAQVEMDGRLLGYTPLATNSVPVGKHMVRVSMERRRPVEVQVEVREGEESLLTELRLEPLRTVSAASRLTEEVDDAPSSVSIITREELMGLGYPTISEALRGLRGVATSHDSVYNNINVRGLGQVNDFGNKLLILSDGAVLNDNILVQSFTGYDGRVDLYDVDRIELVRGPGSVLYGTGAVAGVVNLVPRDPGEGRHAHAAVGTAGDGVGRARAGASGELGEGSWWLSAAGAHTDGVMEEVDIPAEDHEHTLVHGYNAFDAMGLNGGLRSGDWRAQLYFNQRDQQIPTGAYGVIVDNPGTVWMDRRGMGELRYEPELSPKLQLYTRGVFNLYDFDGTYIFDDGEGGELELVERYTGRQLGAEARAVWSPGAHSRLTGGAEVQYSMVARLEGEEAGGAGYLDEDEPTSTVAAYVLLDQDLGPSVQVSAGARADVWSTFGTAISPRLALIWKASPRDVTKVMAGRAFRAPSIYELYYNDGGSVQVRSDFGGNKLGPEQVWSGELEQSHHFARWWTVLGAAWVNHISGSMLTLPADPDDPASPVYYANSDTAALAMGLEAELRREFQDGWMMAVQGSGQRATYLSEGGEQVPNTPVATGSLRLLAPLVDPVVRLGLRGTVEAPRRINLDSNERTETAFIGDVVLSGEVTESGTFYQLGLYNFMDWQVEMPVSGNFATPSMPQSGRTLLLTVGLER